MLKTRTLYILLGLLIPALFLSGWVEQRNYKLKYELIWSQNNISWSNFTDVKNLENDFVATIDSQIFCPNEIPETDFNIYAFMNPNSSFKLHDSLLTDYTLNHEQYHFNITEYHARLLRRDIVKLGKDKLTDKNFDSLFVKYDREKDLMQAEYDSITDHSVEEAKQRYWELKIDDLMRQTTYFQNSDLYSYNAFSKVKTDFYRHVYRTFEIDILYSYPINENESKQGENYKIIKKDSELIIEFYKDGVLVNGGAFKTAITSIKKNDSFTEIRYYNPDESLNDKLPFCVFKRFNEVNKKVDQYYNLKGERVANKGIYQTESLKISNNKYSSTYFNSEMINIRNVDDAFKKNRTLDSLGRTIKMEFYTLDDIRCMDNYFVSQIQKEHNNSHKTISYKEYNADGTFAQHLDSYNVKFSYDERGNLKSSINLNQNSEIAINKDGIAIYNYTYDLSDNVTSIKRYNKFDQPTRGLDNYFMKINKYDYKNRITYAGKFYSGYILAFNENKWGASKYEYPNDSIIYIKNVDVFNYVFNNDNGIAIEKKHINKEGKVERLIYLDLNNNYAKTTDSIIEYRNRYDERGNTIEESTYDSLGNLTPFKSDVAIVKWDFDKNNNKVKTTYYNTQAELANGNQNVTYNIYKYNYKNQLIERSNYNKKMEPTLIDGYFRSEMIPNSRGKDSITYEFDTFNKPLLGVYKTKYIYDKYDNLTFEFYYNNNDELTKNTNGITSINYLYNSKHEYVGYAYFDAFGKRANNYEGVSYNIQKLNEFGYILTDFYYNKHDKPTLGPEGYYKNELNWNDNGEKIGSKIFDVNNELIPDNLGIAEYAYTISSSGLISVIKRYDAKGNLTNNSKGVAESFYKPHLNGLYFLDYELDYLGNEISDDDEEDVE